MIATPAEDHARITERVLALFKLLGVPVSLDKLVRPTTKLEYLGTSIDSVKGICEVTQAKLNKAITLLKRCRGWSVPYKQLESLVGLLQYITNVVRPGKAFLGRLRDSLYKATNFNTVTLGPVGRQDAEWWLKFLPSWPGTTYLAPPVEDASNTVNMVTDASLVAMGAVFGRQWTQFKWDDKWLKLAFVETALSMPCLEVGAILIGLRTWASLMEGKQVVVFSDCEPAIEAIRWGYSPKKNILALIRDITSILIRFSIHLRFIHVPTKANVVADGLSRLDHLQVLADHPWLDRHPVLPQLVDPGTS